MLLIVVDARPEFLEDLRFALFREKGIKVIGMQSAEGLANAVVAHKADKVIISENVLELMDVRADYGLPLSCFSMSPEGEERAGTIGIPSYGLIQSASELIRAVSSGKVPKIPHVSKKASPADEESTPAKETIAKRKQPEEKRGSKTGENSQKKENRSASSGKVPAHVENSPVKKPHPEKERRKEAPVPPDSDSDLPTLNVDLFGDDEESFDDRPEPDTPPKAPGRSVGNEDKDTGMDEPDEVEEDEIDKDIRRDMGETVDGAKIISVYSAKGGVGKTTIAVELATYLSMVRAKAENFSVCLVDFNIDFGDVRTTMGITEKGCSLTYWANDIKEKKAAKKKAKDIQYTEEEVRDWMYKTTTGLYVLPAPLTNEDSMRITAEEMDIVLRNIRDNGGFDYVVCDTGNNTRDSTLIALLYADIILMLVDQNINTAVCDDAFLQTMRKIEFDVDKTKLVVNRIMPKRATRISVEEVLDHFPFECVGQIDFSTDVIRATNLGKPLASNDPNHDFTKQLRKTVSYIIGDSEAEAPPAKGGFLGKLFKKKKM